MNLKYIIYKDKVSKETFWAAVAKGMSVLGGVFFLIFIPKFGGIEMYGNFSLILTYISLFGIFFGSPIHTAVKKEMIEGKFNAQAQKYFYVGFKLKIIFSLFFSALLLILLCIVNIQILKENIALFLILLILMNMWGLITSSLEAIHRLFFEAFIYFLEYSTQILLILYFYYFSALTLQNILISFIAGYFISFLIGFIILITKFEKSPAIKLLSLDVRISKIILPRTFFLALTGISFVLLSKIDLLMISYLLTIEDVGFYSIASDISKHSTIISIPIILGVIPMFITNNNIKKLFYLNMKKLILINTIIFFAIFFGSNIIINLLYGEGYTTVIPLLKIFALFPFVAVLQNFTQEILVLKGESNKIFVFGLISVLVNITLNYFGIILLGIHGAAIATLISYAIWFLMSYYYIKKKYICGLHPEKWIGS